MATMFPDLQSEYEDCLCMKYLNKPRLLLFESENNVGNRLQQWAVSVQSQEVSSEERPLKNCSEFFLTLKITGVLRFFHCSHLMEPEHRIPIGSIHTKQDQMTS